MMNRMIQELDPKGQFRQIRTIRAYYSKVELTIYEQIRSIERIIFLRASLREPSWSAFTGGTIHLANELCDSLNRTGKQKCSPARFSITVRAACNRAAREVVWLVHRVLFGVCHTPTSRGVNPG